MPQTLPEPRPEDLDKLKVLLVDDNANVLRMIGDVLRSAGVGRIETAHDGACARSRISEWDPDIIFSDWHMPVMGGLELTRAIRRAALCPDPRIPNPRVPIILVTSRRSQADVDMARQAGVNEFVIKPFNPTALLSRVQLVLRRPRPFILSEEYVGPDRRRRADPGYAGPMRRATDPIQAMDQAGAVDEAALAAARDTIRLELKVLQGAIVGSGGVNRELLARAYRVLQRINFRTHQVRDTAVQRAAVLLMEYIDAMSDAEHCELDVFNLHFRAIGTLLNATCIDVIETATVIAQLEAVVRFKIEHRRAA
jgi:CheY-like chemotaxis protein